MRPHTRIGLSLVITLTVLLTSAGGGSPAEHHYTEVANVPRATQFQTNTNRLACATSAPTPAITRALRADPRE